MLVSGSLRRGLATVRQVLGSSFVDIELSAEEREQPHLIPSVRSSHYQTHTTGVLLEVIKDLGKFRYRTMPINLPTDGMFRGEEADKVDVLLPVAQLTVDDTSSSLRGRMVNVLGQAVDGKGDITHCVIPLCAPTPPASFFCPMRMLDTGIKAIDLLCPMSVGGKNALVGNVAGVGKTVLLRHLARTLPYDLGVYCAIGSRTTEMVDLIEESYVPDKLVVVNCGMGEPVGARVRALETATHMLHYSSPELSQLMLFVDDLARMQEAVDELQLAKNTVPQLQEASLANGRFTSVQCLSFPTPQLLSAFDTTVVLCKNRAARGLFPAMDFAASRSSLMDATFVGERHVECANAVVATLQRQRELEDFVRTTRMTDDLTEEAQLVLVRGRLLSMYLTQDLEEEKCCSLDRTIQDCEHILAGRYDDVPPQDLFQVGNLPASSGEQQQEEEERDQ